MTDPAVDLPIQRKLIDDSQALAQELNISWSRLITLALRQFIHRYHRHKQLTAQLNAAYADSPNTEEVRLVQAMRSSHRRIVEGES